VTDIDQLRARRKELQEHEDAVSYVRRVAQGRADLARAELARRGSTAAPAGPAGQDELRDILADRLLGANGRPPRPAEDFSGHPLAAELDTLCAEHGFGRMAELDESELTSLTDALDAFEADVSAQRQQVFAELDALTDELVEQYREQQVERS
jgi:hypothetical protein